MTVYENIAYPMRVRRWPVERVKSGVGQALSLVRLSGLEARYPRQLSGGQQQRVAIARAIVFRPAVVLMDEPLGALDRKLREELQGEIRTLHRETGLTVLYVTHDQEEALVMSDMVGVMNNGRLEQLDRPEVVYRSPATRFVASFIGENNFFTGQVVASDDAGTLVQMGPGLVLRAMTRRPRPLGEEVTIAVRPEFIDLTPPHAATVPAENHLSCQVEDLVFTGEQLRLVLKHEILGRILVKNSTLYVEKGMSSSAAEATISFASDRAILV
jgi:ABC-type Fe3+/spermidine/putrescine transport system ATPase subunit